MKKILASLVILTLSATLLAGCSPDELSFLQLNHEISSLDAYTMTGAVNWNTDLEALLGEGSDLLPAEIDSQRELIRIIEEEGLKHLTFSYGIDLNAKAMEAHYAAGNTPLFKLLLKNDVYYVNFDGLLDLVKRNDTQALQNDAFYGKLEVLKGKYLAISVEDLLNSGFASSEFARPAAFQDSLSNQQALRKNVLNYFMDFAKTELSGYNPGLVKKTYDTTLHADVYGYSVNLEQAPLLTLEFILYLLDHLDGTEALVTQIVSDPLIQEQADLDGENTVAEVHSAFDDLRNDLDSTRAILSETIAEEREAGTLTDQVKSSIGSATVAARIAKLGPNKYWNQFSVSLNNPTGQFMRTNASLDATFILNAGTVAAIQAPTQTVPFDTFNDSLPHTLILEPDYDTASYDAGLLSTTYLDADMINSDGHWFISLASLPDHFKTLVTLQGSQLVIGGKTLMEPTDLQHRGDATYVALTAFKHAGATLTWDAEYRTLTLEN